MCIVRHVILHSRPFTSRSSKIKNVDVITKNLTASRSGTLWYQTGSLDIRHAELAVTRSNSNRAAGEMAWW